MSTLLLIATFPHSAAAFAVRAVVPLFVCLTATLRSFSGIVALFLPAGLLASSGIYGVLLFIVKKGADV